MDDQIFADGISAISVIGGTARIDFVVFSPVEKEPNGQPKAVHRHRLILPMEAFLQSAEKIHEAAQTIATRARNGETPAPPPPAANPAEQSAAESAPKPPAKPPFP